MVKETGIIMSGNHPKLILDRIKTQTRRTSGLKGINLEPDKWISVRRDQMIGIPLDTFIFHNKEDRDDGESIRELIKCPYGQVGDRLWVRETFTWVTLGEKDPWKDRAIADGTFRRMPNGEPVKMCYKADGYEIGSRWYPSIHMPRWASRITLEITKVRAERVQEITEVDAKAEGLKAQSRETWWCWCISFKVVK